MNLFRRSSKAQNVIEYILLVIAVVVVLIVLLGKGGAFSTAVNSLLAKPQSLMNQE